MKRHLRFIPAIALMASAGIVGCDDEPGTVAVRAEMRLSAAQIDFGEVQIGTSSNDRQVIIENTGGAALEVTVVRGSQFNVDVFDIVPPQGRDERTGVVRIAPGAATTVGAVFAPQVLGPVESVVVVRANIGGEQVEETIVLRGEGVTSQIVATPERLSFGNVLFRTTKSLNVELTNSSQFNADIDFLSDQNVAICGTNDPSAFCLVAVDSNFRDDESFSLAAGETVTLEVRFQPLIANTQERGQFTLRYCPEGNACEVEIRMDGFSVESGFQCEPQTVDFGAVNPGACGEQIVTCSNIANEQITVLNWTTSAASSPDFIPDDVVATVLQPPEGNNPGGSVAIGVQYCPETLGDDEGTLVVTTDSNDPTRARTNVPMVGSGGGPDIDVLPAQVNFGLCSLLAPCRRSVVISNSGFEELRLESVVVDSEGTGSFVSQDEGGDIIEPGGSKVIDIDFQPRQEGEIETRMVITSNDQDEPTFEVRLIGEGINLPPCNYEVSTNNLNFGVLEVNKAGFRPFEIRNVSTTSQCLITSVRMSADSDVEFNLPDGEVTSVLLEPSTALAVRVAFLPETTGRFDGKVEFSISNPETPFNTVNVTGTSSEATLLIVPNDLFFGTIEVGCSARAKSVIVYNTGATSAQINSISLDTAPGVFTLRNVPDLPINMAPGSNFEFEVGFTAPAVSDYAGAIEMVGTFDGDDVLYVISVQGAGATDAIQIDQFSQLGRPEVDILFVIDDSCSMGGEQDALRENFGAFIRFAEAQALDYHIAVTGTKDNITEGPFRPDSPASNRIVTPRTQPSPIEVFQQNADLGATGDGEATLGAAYKALTPPLSTGRNAGFLRRDAVLSIVGVTDQFDESSLTPDFYLNFFRSIKGFRNTQLFSFSAINGGESGCPGATAGPDLVNIANLTGGVSASICTRDWGTALEDLSREAFGFKSRFFLTNQPVIQSVEVFVNDERFPATEASGRVNWNYDFTTNSVNFTPLSVPDPGDDIRIEYSAECL